MLPSKLLLLPSCSGVSDISLISPKTTPMAVNCSGTEYIKLLIIVPLDEHLVSGLTAFWILEDFEDLRYSEAVPDLVQSIYEVVPVSG